MVACVGYMRNG